MTLDEMRNACLAMARGRKDRDEAWATADTHLRACEEAMRMSGAMEAFALRLDTEEAHRATLLRKAPLFRQLALAHARLAREFAGDAGLDVSGVEIPSE